ncbi:hypothetical protein EDB19DRAFT_416855 [Suillus lakei]|nr:hypothetical protein EDB19DRAFT_416855 [Suillus lakei]
MKFISLTTMIMSAAVLADIVTAQNPNSGSSGSMKSMSAESSRVITITMRFCFTARKPTLSRSLRIVTVWTAVPSLMEV